MVVKQKVKQGYDERKLKNAEKHSNDGEYKKRQNEPAIGLCIS